MKQALTTYMWRLYGYTYDGLLSFWPYVHLLDLVVDYLAPQRGERILEVGCGTGNVLVRVLETPETTVVGVDISHTMLRMARKKLAKLGRTRRAEIVEDELISWLKTQPAASFDAAVSVNVLYAIDDQAAFWRELYRVVKPGGRVVVTTSVRPGSGPIIREQLDNDKWWRLITPKLLGVFVVDAIINLLGHSGSFAFHDEASMKAAVAKAGGVWDDRGFCYGGSEAGVNLLFRVTIPA